MSRKFMFDAQSAAWSTTKAENVAVDCVPFAFNSTANVGCVR